MPTLAEMPPPLVLVVGGSTRLLELCAEAAAIAAAARVKDCTLAAAPTMGAKWLPLAIVLTEATYAKDPEDLEALARDIRAKLVRLPNESIAPEVLQAMLL